ncbi:hypothetical protein [Rhizobium skierniewicense]|uniref:hypothetical protein n=1 Tax=Rhizobium skierniewicense TaxID=984260 RepID=UPI00157195AF|nr:hypothetical protein [Rhizobium skierniewicense]NTF32343.1 hypothetical protein [Rhizobium skierniewicense]
MTERRWYPKFLIDEVLPEGRVSAEAWLPLLASLSTAGEPWFIPGDTVDFQYCERRGVIDLTVQHDGSHDVVLRCPETPDMFVGSVDQPEEARKEIGPSANSFWDHETETFAETLTDFARMYAENMIDDDEETVSIETAYWSDTFRYRISDDGKSLTLETENSTASAQENLPC